MLQGLLSRPQFYCRVHTAHLLTISGRARRTIAKDEMLRLTTVKEAAAERMGIGCNSAGTA